LHNVDTGVNAASKTANSGFYRFSSVAPGNYTVVATSAGFKTSSVAVLVTTAETRGVDVTLQVAGDNTHVTVNTIATALNPEETRVQTTLSAEEIGRLPLPNRDVQQLIALTPGVVGFQNESPTNGYGSSIFAGNFSPGYSANGLGNSSNLFLIDDLPVNDAQQQGAALLLPNAEMIGQVALQTQTYSVENGTAASLQVAFTTKSGANALHGTVDYSYLSSNIGAAKIGIEMGETNLHQYILDYGFGKRTGIPLPSESPGIVHDLTNWTKLSISRIPMGHEVCVTPLQMTMAMSAIANGGVLMRPMLVSRLQLRDGSVVQRYLQV